MNLFGVAKKSAPKRDPAVTIRENQALIDNMNKSNAKSQTEINDLVQQMGYYKKSGHIDRAKAALASIRQKNKFITTNMKQISNMEGLINNIRSALTTQQVFQQMTAGVQTHEQALQGTTIEQMEDLMDKMEEHKSTTEEMNEILARSSEPEITDEEFEEEMAMYGGFDTPLAAGGPDVFTGMTAAPSYAAPPSAAPARSADEDAQLAALTASLM